MPNIPAIAASKAGLVLSSFGESWTRHPLGVAASAEPVTTVPSEPEAVRSTEDGRKVEHARSIDVDASQQADTDDR